MKKDMTITYIVDSALYVNVTNRCTNNCEFCIRKNGDGAYGSDSLWLEREPTEEEILDSVFARDLSVFSEIVFCGYGEPSIRLDVCRSVALKIKERAEAKAAKNYALADQIRAELSAKGVTLIDTKEGTKYTVS